MRCVRASTSVCDDFEEREVVIVCFRFASLDSASWISLRVSNTAGAPLIICCIFVETNDVVAIVLSTDVGVGTVGIPFITGLASGSRAPREDSNADPTFTADAVAALPEVLALSSDNDE